MTENSSLSHMPQQCPVKLGSQTHVNSLAETYDTPPLFLYTNPDWTVLEVSIACGGCHFQLQAGSAMNLQPIDLLIFCVLM